MVELKDYRETLDILAQYNLRLHTLDEKGLELLRDKHPAAIDFTTHYVTENKKIIWYGRTEHLLQWLKTYEYNKAGIKAFLDSREPFVED